MNLYGTDREVLETVIDWLEQGHEVALVTVAKTWGSSPRPVGSLMAMRRDGVHTGSVSGGCVEEDLTGRYRNSEIGPSFPTLIDYGVDREQASRFGLPCGGRLELLIERIMSAQELHTLIDNMASGQLVKRRVCLQTGEVSLHTASPQDEFVYHNGALEKIFGPSWRLLLIGAGHLSRYVAKLAVMLDYRVTVCDPRPEYHHAWDMEGVEFTAVMPDDVVRHKADHERSVVLTLTHDPKLDDMALLEALNSKALYVGALGSKRNNEKRRQRLAQMGVRPAQLKQLHAPVGLPIGSRTPPEIALSIMAEVTAVRRHTHRVAHCAASAA